MRFYYSCPALAKRLTDMFIPTPLDFMLINSLHMTHLEGEAPVALWLPRSLLPQTYPSSGLFLDDLNMFTCQAKCRTPCLTLDPRSLSRGPRVHVRLLSLHSIREKRTLGPPPKHGVGGGGEDATNSKSSLKRLPGPPRLLEKGPFWRKKAWPVGRSRRQTPKGPGTGCKREGDRGRRRERECVSE